MKTLIRNIGTLVSGDIHGSATRSANFRRFSLMLSRSASLDEVLL